MVDFKKLLDDIPKEKIWKNEIYLNCKNRFHSKYGIGCRLLSDSLTMDNYLDGKCSFHNCKKRKK